MAENSENIRDQYIEILRSNGILDPVSDVVMTDSGAKGDGMYSLTKCVTVTFEDKEKAPLNLFVKLPTGNPTNDAMLTHLKAFEKESRVLMEYLPEARKLCKSKGLDDLLDFFPKCYYGDEKLVVLENLTLEKGHKILPHEDRHDIEAATLTLKLLAKYHAVSVAMIKEYGGKDKFAERFPNLDYDPVVHPMMLPMMIGFVENSLKTTITILEKNKSDEVDAMVAKLKSFLGAASSDNIAEGRRVDPDDLLVLTHGDFKNNNLMFLKNKDTSALEHLIAIDFQCVFYSAPVSDLVVYLFSSVDSKLRQENLEELLKIYLDTLNQVSKDLGCPTELSYEDLMLAYRKKFKFGFFFGLSLVGPGMGILKLAEVDVSKVEMSEMVNVFSQCLLKWIDQNPEKGIEMAEEVKGLLEEYSKLEL